MRNLLNRLIDLYRRTFWSYAKQAKYAGVKMGENNFIDSHFWTSEPYLIEIGDNCQITGGGKILYTRRCWGCTKKISQV